MNDSYIKKLINVLEFIPKESSSDVYEKIYADGYVIELDFNKQIINYGDKIKSNSKTTGNFSQPENFVVLECVNRLLEKGYKPNNIVLEKTFPLGHNSGRLDILVTRDDGTAYLMIECKTYGKEFDKAFNKLKENGGQLFTYFQQDKDADVLMLYASELKGSKFIFNNEIIYIEDDYRKTNNVEDLYNRWNKLPVSNGIFEDSVEPYKFMSKALTLKELKDITQNDSSFIFNRFLEILRHNVVSDKPNAFNKIFTLFLCKVYDEKTAKENEPLKFQWLEGKDDNVSFQIRLTNLYKDGMRDFLEKEVTDFSESDFKTEYKELSDDIKLSLLHKINKLRLEKNNEFAIKEVYDEKSFKENAVIVKEVVVLLQNFRLRYNKRQQYLSDFFELLLTTGLKQESGQFFTPVPIAQFIIKSLPIDTFVDKKLQAGKTNDLLPYLMDYASGSGHFLTESMHELQRLINKKKPENYIDSTARKIKGWHSDHFDWATQYIYGVEKDYRLVKVGKVGCYLHGDGLANVILSDGLANFKDTEEYKDLLKRTDKNFPKENKQFDILVSNPPYSISAFRPNARNYYTEKDFELYNYLTDNSSEIECLFVERMKQLLKDGGVAGIILPSSMLSNDGIYTKAREIILRNFEIIAITELGSNTFMATGTNTVVLFLRRRNNYDSTNLQKSIERFFDDWQDVTRNGIEKPVAKYVNHVWENVNLKDYITMLKKEPSKIIAEHEIYRDYRKNLKGKSEKDFWNVVIETEKEKLLYFILAYHQRVVLIKTGGKDAEKRFLGYEFSYRRGSEGIHPIQRVKTISECTSLFDEERFDNPEKTSTYIYKAFTGDYETPVHKTLGDNVFRVSLVDMLTFDRAGFIKNISTAIKKKVKIESKWDVAKLGDIAHLDWGNTNLTKTIYKNDGRYNVYSATGLDGKTDFYEQEDDAIILSAIGARCGKCFYAQGKWTAIKNTIIIKSKEGVLLKYLFQYVNDESFWIKSGTAQPFITLTKAQNQKIPLPPLNIQDKIVSKIETLEKKETEVKEKLTTHKNAIQNLINAAFLQNKSGLLGDFCESVEYGTSAKSEKTGMVPVIRMGNIQDGKIDWNDLVYTSNTEEISKYSLKMNDVLFNRTNSPELVGKAGIYKGEQSAIFAGYLIRINYKKDLLDPVFLVYILNSEKIRNHGFSVMSKSVNQANINGTLLKAYKIPYPPISEQKKIVSKIEKLEIQIAEAEKVIGEILKQKKDVLKKYL